MIVNQNWVLTNNYNMILVKILNGHTVNWNLKSYRPELKK